MELRHLRYFIAVAQSGSFTRAALALGIQQPPLSLQVRDLERELGYPLFRRLPRGVELTEGGAVFLEEATAIIAAVSRGVARASQVAHGSAGSLELGFTSSAMLHRFTPDLIRRYREAHPSVELAIHEYNAAAVTEAVASRQLDIGFIRRPVSEHSGIAFDIVASEPMLVALPSRHPLAARARQGGIPKVRLRELAAEPFILVRRPGAPGMYGDLIEACRKAGFSPNVVAEVGQMLTNVTLVAAGVGVSMVPASMRDIHHEDVCYAEAEDAPQLAAPLTLVSRAGETNPVAQRFVRLARESGAAAGAPAPYRPAPGARREAAGPRPKPRSRARTRRP